MKRLPYLRACMKEAQRVIPIVNGFGRKLSSELVLQGYTVPKGTNVLIPHNIIAMQEDNFAKAAEFIPERWLKSGGEAEALGCPHSKMTSPFAYTPFGVGKRICIGKRLAELETSIVMTRMVREFKLTWHYAEPKVVTHILRQIEGDFKLRLDATAQ